MSSLPRKFIYKTEVFFDQLDALGSYTIPATYYSWSELKKNSSSTYWELMTLMQNAMRISMLSSIANTRFRQPLSQPGGIEIRYTLNRIRSSGVTMNFENYCKRTQTLLCSGDRTV